MPIFSGGGPCEWSACVFISTVCVYLSLWTASPVFFQITGVALLDE